MYSNKANNNENIEKVNLFKIRNRVGLVVDIPHTLTLMAELRIALDTSIFGGNAKQLQVSIGPESSASKIISDALKKCRVNDLPEKYQVWIISKTSCKFFLLLLHLNKISFLVHIQVYQLKMIVYLNMYKANWLPIR